MAHLFPLHPSILFVPIVERRQPRSWRVMSGSTSRHPGSLAEADRLAEADGLAEAETSDLEP